MTSSIAGVPQTQPRPTGSTGLLHYFPAKIIPAAIGFAIVVVLTHRLSVAEYGRYARVIAAAVLIDAALSTWLRQSVLRFFSEFRLTDAVLRFQRTMLPVVAGETILGGVITLFGLRILGFPWLDAALVSALIMALMPFTYFSSAYQADGQSREYAFGSAVQSVAQLSIIVVSVVVFSGGFAAAASAMVVGTICATTFMVGRARKRGLPLHIRGTQPVPDLMRRSLSYGVPMSAWLLLMQVQGQASRLIIAATRGEAELGAYAPVFDLINGSLSLLMTPFLLAAHPLIMSAWTRGEAASEIERLLSAFTRPVIIVIVPMVGLSLVLGKPAFSVLLGAEYGVETWVIVVIVLASCVGGLAMYAHKGLELANKTSVMLWIGAVAAVLSVVGNLLWVPPFGYGGAAGIWLISNCAYFALVYLRSRHILRLVVSIKTVARVVMAAALATLILYLSLLLIGSPRQNLLTLVASALAGMLMYVGLLVLLGETSLTLRNIRAWLPRVLGGNRLRAER